MEQVATAPAKVSGKTITIGPDGKKIYPEGTVRTKLKFVKSEQSGLPIGFVSQNPKSHRINGVREDSPFPKQVCIVDAPLVPEILLGVLYQVAIVPMRTKKGYVVIEAEPYQFKAEIETVYVRNAIYIVHVKFGNKTITFDPKDGRNASYRTLQGVKEILEKRVDIQNVTQVVEDFVSEATALLKHYERDGYYVKPA